MAKSDAADDRRLNWLWIIGCIIVGAVLVGLAFYAQDHWRWKGISLSTLVTFGAAFALAGVLFLVERRFTKVVRSSVQRVEQAETAFEERATALEKRLADLTAATEARVQARAAEQDAAVQGFVEDVSFASVTRLLGSANEMNAIDRGMVTVQGGPSPEGIWLSFAWGYDADRSHRVGDQLTPKLEVRVRFGDSRLASDRSEPFIELLWQPDEPADAFGARIVGEIQKRGLWRAGELDMSLAFENLRRSIDTALKSQRDEPAAWKLHGALIELIGTEWALTAAGVEAPNHNFMLPQTDFPAEPGPGLASFRPVKPVARAFDPKPPSWGDADEWQFVIRQAKQQFPRNNSIVALIATSWSPCPLSWDGWQQAARQRER